MTTLEQTLLTIALLLEAVLLLLALHKGRIKVCYAFFIYLAFDLVSSLILAKTGDRDFYKVQSLLLDFIKIGIVLELNHKIFKYYPRIRRSSAFILIAAIILFFVYYRLTPQQKQDDWWFSVASDLHSKILQTICAVFLYMVGSILFYRLQIATAHKFLVLGVLISQLPMALGFAVMATFGQNARIYMNYLNSVFFILALIIWTGVYLSHDKNLNPLGTATNRLASASNSGPAK